MHRPARCRDREWTGGVDDPQPDRHTGKIAIRSEFLGSLNAFQLGRLARIRAIDPSRTTNTRTGLSTWEGGRRNLRFADSLLEGDGFEPSVPRMRPPVSACRPTHGVRFPDRAAFVAGSAGHSTRRERGMAWKGLDGLRQKQHCRRFTKLTFQEIDLADRL